MADFRDGPTLTRMSRGALRALVVFGPWTLLLALIWRLAGPVAQMHWGSVRVDLLTFVYAPGAAMTGALIGLLHPWANRDSDYALASGLIAVAPWTAGIVWTMSTSLTFWADLFVYVFVTAIIGWQFAHVAWRNHWEDESTADEAA